MNHDVKKCDKKDDFCVEHENRQPNCVCTQEKIRETAKRLNISESDAEKHLRGEAIQLNE